MSPRMRVGVYPGTFDPITYGHMDIIARAATHLVDHLVIAVAENVGKGPMFNSEERTAMVQAEIDTLDEDVRKRIEVDHFHGLLIDYTRNRGASAIIRGLRAVSDFEYEFQMTGMNTKLDPEIETVFLMASDRFQFISSGFVKEIARLGGQVEQFVSPRVLARLNEKVAANRP